MVVSLYRVERSGSVLQNLVSNALFLLVEFLIWDLVIAKERSGFGGGGYGGDDAKFAGNWRREGPLPDAPGRDSSRRRDGPVGERAPTGPSVSDNASDWRSSRQRLPPPEPEPQRRKGPGLFSPDGQSAADKEENWTIGAKFKPSTNGASDEGSGPKFARRGDMGPPAADSDWRSGPRTSLSRQSTSREFA